MRTGDYSAGYYGDLAAAHATRNNARLWNGMGNVIDPPSRQLSGIRFTCGQVGAAYTVDLSFCNVVWYAEFTGASNDAQSCFSEQNGAGDDPPPACHNNISSVFLHAGNQWGAGYLEGEDSCGDTGDFIVDFGDRGMDWNQGDGTDWGEDDSTAKCGQNGVNRNTYAWYVYVCER